MTVSNIPYDAQVAYLESTGTQYIDTNYILSNNQNNRLYIECASTNNNGAYKWIFGSKGGTKQSVFAFANSGGSLYTEIKGSNWTSSDYKFALDSQNTIELNSTSIIFNGSPYSHGGSFVYSGVSITIFGCKTSTGLYDNKFIGRIYAAKIYDNNVLVRDFIPVRVGQEGCLYDKVSGELFSNAGTGNFILGNDLLNVSGFVSSFRRRLLSTYKAPMPNYLCFTALESGTFTITIPSALTTSQLQYIEYSINEEKTWTRTDNVNSQQIVITTPTINSGDKVYWRGIGTQMAQGFKINPTVVSSTCRFDASGEVMSLLKGKDFKKSRNVGHSAFGRLFFECTTIINARDLIIDINGAGSYVIHGMFQDCSNLISTPYINVEGAIGYPFYSMFENCTSLIELTYPLPIPSTANNRLYRRMFYGCTSLKKAPAELSTLTEFATGAYMEMFYGCTSLTDIPSILPSTSLTDSCYCYMFYNCTSLTYAPQLPATTITGEAYFYMFNGCTSLVNVPDIHVTQVTGYNAMYGMFWKCTSLTYNPIKTAPSSFSNTGIMCMVLRDCPNVTGEITLPAETLTANCYGSAFRRTKITYIKMLATDISASGCLSYWLDGVPNVSTSIFVKHIDATWTTTGVSGVPTNWTVLYYDPDTDKYYLSDKVTECDDHGNPI